MNTEEKDLVKQFNKDFANTVLPVTIFVIIETVTGFFGNLLVLYVFLFRYHVCNFRYFVLCLAITDLLSTLTTMPGEVLTQLMWYVYPVRTICKIKSFFNIFTVSMEAFCLFTIALDRYRKVCQPFGWQIRPRIAVRLCVGICAISTILALPCGILWGTRKLPKIYKNTTITVTICEKDKTYADTRHPLQYSSSVEGIISTLLVLMFVLYVLIALKLAKQRKNVSSVRVASSVPKIVVVGSTSATSGASSDVGGMPSKAEVSDAGDSSEKSSKNKPHDHYVSSDGGLTTDEEIDKSISSVLEIPDQRRSPRQHTKKRHRLKQSQSTRGSVKRLRRKTKIMFVLTLTFVITVSVYLALLSIIAKSDDVLQQMNDTERAFYFLFFRLYFINHVMNPIVYGFLDQHFQKVMKQLKNKFLSCHIS